MLTRMTEEDWATVLQVFRACRSAAGRQGPERPDLPRSGALFLRSQHHVARSAGRMRELEFTCGNGSGA